MKEEREGLQKDIGKLKAALQHLATRQQGMASISHASYYWTLLKNGGIATYYLISSRQWFH